MRVLAVDFGERRIGMAVSDESGRIVVPVGAFVRKSDAQAATVVTEAAKEREVERVVVGDPVRLDGTESTTTRRARNFAKRLRDLSGLPVELHAEGLTTHAAEGELRDAGLDAPRRAAARDAEAAAVLLRDYLSEHPGPAGAR